MKIGAILRVVAGVSGAILTAGGSTAADFSNGFSTEVSLVFGRELLADHLHEGFKIRNARTGQLLFRDSASLTYRVPAGERVTLSFDFGRFPSNLTEATWLATFTAVADEGRVRQRYAYAASRYEVPGAKEFWHSGGILDSTRATPEFKAGAPTADPAVQGDAGGHTRTMFLPDSFTLMYHYRGRLPGGAGQAPAKPF